MVSAPDAETTTERDEELTVKSACAVSGALVVGFSV